MRPEYQPGQERKIAGLRILTRMEAPNDVPRSIARPSVARGGCVQ
jgi:hypothetical protein